MIRERQFHHKVMIEEKKENATTKKREGCIDKGHAKFRINFE